MSSIAETSGTASDERISQIAAFIGTFAVIFYYALRGGSYDVVVRQEEAIAVWWVVGLGWASGVLPRYQRPRGGLLPLVALAGLIIWTALGLEWTSSDSRTLAEVARGFHYAGIILLVWSFVGRDNWRAAGAGLIAAAATVSAMSLASRVTPGLFPGNQIKVVLGTNRLNYPFNYWNAVAAWAAMTIGLVLAVSAHARTAWLRALCAATIPLCATTAYLTYARQSVLGVAVAVMAVFVLSRNRWTVLGNAALAAVGGAIAILAARGEPAIVNATSGQGGGRVVLAVLLGGAVAAAGAAISLRVNTDRVRLSPRASRATLLTAASVALLVAATVTRPAISDAWDEFRNVKLVTSTSADPAARFGNLNGGRYDQWRIAIEEFNAHPVGGTGAGTFEWAWNREGDSGFVRDAHSLYFESLAELGAVGFALVLIFLLGLIYVAMRGRRHLEEPQDVGLHCGLTAAFVVFLAHAAVDWVWETTAIAVLAVTGIALAGARRRRYHSPQPVRRGTRVPGGNEHRRRTRWAWHAGRFGIPAVAVIAILVQIPNLASTSAIRKSQAAFQRRDIRDAATLASDAIHAAPWASDGYIQRALVFESQDRLAAAASDLRHAIEREPFNWRPHLLLSRVEAERGRVRAALRAFAEFRRLRPKSFYRIGSA